MMARTCVKRRREEEDDDARLLHARRRSSQRPAPRLLSPREGDREIATMRDPSMFSLFEKPHCWSDNKGREDAVVRAGLFASASMRFGPDKAFGAQTASAIGWSKQLMSSRPMIRPSRILDAPEIVDDYYLNLIDWSSSDILAIALATDVYLWSAATNEVTSLLSLAGEVVTSVAWSPQGTHLCVGTDSGEVQLYDAATRQMVRSMQGHRERVGSLAWNPVSRCVSSGSRDAHVHQHDARLTRHRTATLLGHTQEVCGLAWSSDGSTLASGGNENLLCLWDAAKSSSTNAPSHPLQSWPTCTPRLSLRQHRAAVKALAWCPHRRAVLASGSGTADRTIRLWNTSNGLPLHTIETSSQVSALCWSRTAMELCSAHGYATNELALWAISPGLTNHWKVAQLRGHTARILHLAQSPDGATVVSASSDETIRFWPIFEPRPLKRLDVRRGAVRRWDHVFSDSASLATVTARRPITHLR